MAGAESRAGGPLTEYPATLSRDAKFLFTCCGAAVRVYSVHTGSLIQTLEGHTAGVSGACSFPDDAQHVYSFSLDGTIRKWAWEAGKLLQTYDVGFPIDAWVMVAGDAKAFYVATTKRVNKKVMTQEGDEKVQKRPGKVGRVEITAEGSTFTQLFEVSKIANFAAGKEWIAVSNKKKLTLYHVATKVTRVFRHPREVTALAFHPTEDYLITGEVNGSISRWQSLSVHERDEPIATNYHWHAHACHAVAFTPDGAYVLSGGEESVLVVWQLETGKKTFVPRIGRGPITNICVANDSSVYAVSLQDNGIHIINAFSMKQDQLIQGISNALLPIDWRPLVGFVQDPRTNCIVTNTYPGFASLQVYDVLRDAHVGDFEVEPQSVAIKGKAYEMRVEHIAFNADGSACATVDRYYSAYGSSAPCALKFWSRNSGQAFSFSLNSRTDAAHKAPITAIAYHPREHMVVSAGQDRKFKVWVRIVRDKTRESNPTATPAYSWQCRSVGTYHNRNPEAVAFSTDGSLLAVSYGPVVTLWDPALNMLKHTLTQPHSEDPVRRVAFVPHSPYLVGHTDFDLVVWNLLTGGVWWSYRLHATALAVDTRTARFAVAAAADAHNADFLLVFNAADPKPVRITRFASGARLRELAWLADASAQSSALVYATSDRVFYVARDKPSLEAARSSLPVVSAATPSLLAQLVPELEAAEREAEAAHASLVPLVPQDCHPLPGLEDVPSHTLPPVQDLFDAFFDRMMALRADATAHADDGAEVTMSDVSKQSTKAPLYSIGSEGEAKTAATSTHAEEATSEPALEDDEAGDREAEEEAEEALFDFDEMVAFIKQMRIGGGGADAAEAEAEAEASVPSATKSKKPKKKADDDSAPAAADSHADATHASAKTKGKRDAAAEATEPQAPSTPKGRRNNAAAATAASADEVSAPPRKTPRRKGKGGEEDAEEAAASEAEAVAAATEAKTPRAKHSKETVAAVAEAKTPRRRGKGDEEGAAAEAKTPAAHANGTSRAAASDKEAADTKTPRRRGRAAAALDDESQQTDEPHGGPRRSTRHAGHAAE